MHYTKSATTFDAQLELLRQRGLTINDPDRALHWLRQVSYYRLSAYFLPFKDGDVFRKNTEFDQIAGLYVFDRKLRLLVLDAIERIEVSIRTTMTYEIAHNYGPFGHSLASNFDPKLNHSRLMEDLAREESRANETFASHFRRKYTSEQQLPVWMATELLSFGAISRLYKAMDPSLKSVIATPFGIQSQFLASWLHTLSYVRNVCAHHKRLWNRAIAVTPSFPSRNLAWPHEVPDSRRLYAVLAIIRFMLRVVSPNGSWRDRLFNLLQEHPEVSTSDMKFARNWKDRALWR